MIVLEPAPAAPRRNASPEASASPAPEKARDFDVLLAEEETGTAGDPPVADLALLAADPTTLAAPLASMGPTAPGAVPPVAPAAPPLASTGSAAPGAAPSVAPAAPPRDGVPAQGAAPAPAPARTADTPAGKTLAPDAPALPVEVPTAGDDQAAATDSPLALRTTARSAAPTPPPAAPAPVAVAGGVPVAADPASADTAMPSRPEADPRLLAPVREADAAPAAGRVAAAPTADPAAAAPQLLTADPSVATAPSPPVETATLHRHGALHAVADPGSVAGQIALAVSETDRSRIELRLDPPELGRVHIQMTSVDGAVHAVVAAQRPETQDFLRRHAETLAQELAAAGYGEVSLDFAAQDEAPQGRDEPPASDWHTLALAPERPSAPAAPRAGTSAGTSAGLDIRL